MKTCTQENNLLFLCHLMALVICLCGPTLSQVYRNRCRLKQSGQESRNLCFDPGSATHFVNGRHQFGSIQQKQLLWKICKSKASLSDKMGSRKHCRLPCLQWPDYALSMPLKQSFRKHLQVSSSAPNHIALKLCLEEKASWKIPLPHKVELIS